MSAALRLGVAGCGAMGLPMAEALAEAGLDVRGFDIRPRPGAFMSDLDAFAAHAEAVFTVVRDVEETEALLFSGQGLVARAPALRCLALASTLPPGYVRELRDRLPARVALVDAPMSGAPAAARERRLSFMLGGDTADIALLDPALRAMAGRVAHLGPLGAGMTMKVMNNLVAAASVAATRTALDWAEAAGIEPEAARAVMEASSGQTWVSRNLHAIDWIDEGFAPGNTMGILAKDLACAEGAAPPGADTALVRALIAAIRGLSPRT